MVVVAADHRVKIEKLTSIVGVAEITLATEEEFKSQFPECEVGAMPPSGNLYGMETFIEKTLLNQKYLAFNGRC